MDDVLNGARRARTWLFPLCLLFLLAGCAPITPEAPGTGAAALPATAAPAAEIPTVTVEVTADGNLVAPTEVPSGIVRFDLVGTNTSTATVDIGYLVEGTTHADLEKALETANDDPAAALKLVHVYGASSFTNELVFDLPAGEYMALYNVGQPSQQVAYFMAGADSGAAAPQADVVIKLTDFAFVMPDTIPAGKHTWEISNEGKQWHMMLIMQPAEGQTADDIIAMMSSNGPPPAGAVEPKLLFDYNPISEGNRAWLTVDLPPGDYLAVCPLPDLTAAPDAMMSHAAKGMVRMFTVE